LIGDRLGELVTWLGSGCHFILIEERRRKERKEISNVFPVVGSRNFERKLSGCFNYKKLIKLVSSVWPPLYEIIDQTKFRFCCVGLFSLVSSLVSSSSTERISCFV